MVYNKNDHVYIPVFIVQMKEGEYLELVNDLKEQYDEMKEGLLREVEYYRQELQMSKNQLAFYRNQFESPRPSGRLASYTSVPPLHVDMNRAPRYMFYQGVCTPY